MGWELGCKFFVRFKSSLHFFVCLQKVQAAFYAKIGKNMP
ncbi:hypothetical protein HMPREF0476_0333 [Kingella kingae ATCC 23330]|uniref:Uncharacterized protein n=1 Tax=Kingella kingae ATCC 23330 TaxID=887327 RepID=F5S550_KINKI|nr:hypothetical protein HMPREF0476_0333 [Kingella kingae ATCC 23330]